MFYILIEHDDNDFFSLKIVKKITNINVIYHIVIRTLCEKSRPPMQIMKYNLKTCCELQFLVSFCYVVVQVVKYDLFLRKTLVQPSIVLIRA